MGSLAFSPGSLVTRADVKALYGGGTRRGIEASNDTANVFIYSDRKEGERSGYGFDEWSADRSIFYYTGEGKLGNQRLISGNRAILEHRSDGRSLHLFVAAMDQPTGGKLHYYIGEFQIDGHEPYDWRSAPDTAKRTRSVVVFHLRPVDAVFRDDQIKEPLRRSAGPKSELVALEKNLVREFDQPETKARVATRTEAALLARYAEYLQGDLGREVGRNRVPLVDEAGTLLTDLYDVTKGELYEAKGATTRGAIRTAIGQLLDYRRHITDHQRGNETLLLPSRPAPDLVDLIHSCGMTCVYATPTGFVRLGPGEIHFRSPDD